VILDKVKKSFRMNPENSLPLFGRGFFYGMI